MAPTSTQERLARGRLFGQPGRASELLRLLDREPETVPPDDQEPARAWWRRTRTNVTRKLATACPHTDRPAHSKGRCHSCATRAWYADHPQALARDRARIEANRRARVRAKWGLPLDAPDDEVKRVANRVGSLDMWRKRKADAIRRARSYDSRRMSNYKTLTLNLGRRVPFEDDGL